MTDVTDANHDGRGGGIRRRGHIHPGRSWLPIVASLAALAMLPATGRADPCEAPRDLVRLEAPLGNLAKAVAASPVVRIVALGSSSTAGTGASAPANTYPARLDAELDRRFPGHDFQVVNRGIGGQLAADMLARIARDVLPLEPALVIWQTGVNDAIRDVPIEDFNRTLAAGIGRLKAAGSDVLLVGLQYYPRSERVAAYAAYRDTLNRIAREHEVSVFRRFAIMRHYIESGRFGPEDLLAADRFHMNDFSYGCLAVLMADAIAENVRALGPSALDRGRTAASRAVPRP